MITWILPSGVCPPEEGVQLCLQHPLYHPICNQYRYHPPYHAIIHSALKYAVKTDMLLQNVADKVDRPKKNDFQPVFLSAEEMQKMFEALRGTMLELPVLVAAFYGFRRGEVLGLHGLSYGRLP